MKRQLKYILMTIMVLALLIPTLASCGVTKYTVDFMIDGETYATVITRGDEILSLPDAPERAGYEFYGWYLDRDTWDEPFLPDAFLEGSLTESVSVHAKYYRVEIETVTSPEVGVAYKLFLDQDTLGGRYYVDGTVEAKHLCTTSVAEDAVNVYLERTSVAGRYNLFCVIKAARRYINILADEEGKLGISLDIGSKTTYKFDSERNTLIARVGEDDFLLGLARNDDKEHLGVRYSSEHSFVAHLVLSTEPDRIIPNARYQDSKISGILSGDLGMYKTVGTVVAVGGDSFVLSDSSGKIVVYCGLDWTPDVEVGSLISIAGDVTRYGNSKQFGITSSYNVVGVEDVTYPNPTKAIAIEVSGYVNKTLFEPKYVSINGTLVSTDSGYVIVVGGATMLVKLSSLVENLEYLNETTVQAVGYVTAVTDDKSYVNMITTSVTVWIPGLLPDISGGSGGSGQRDPMSIEKLMSYDYYLMSACSTRCTVVALCSGGFIIGDGTGFMYASVSGGVIPEDITVGTGLLVEGSVLRNDRAICYFLSSYTVIDDAPSVTVPEVKEIDAEALLEYTNQIKVTTELVRIVGVLDKRGSRHVLIVDGTEIEVLIMTPTEDISSMNGKEIEVTGYVVGYKKSEGELKISPITVISREDGEGMP